MIKNFLFFVVIFVMTVSCGHKKKSMAGEDDVNLHEFLAFFPEVQLPFTYSDSLLSAKTDDSLLISPEIFNQFISDSFLITKFDKTKPKLYAIGKFKEADGMTYLMSKATTPKLKMVVISAYDAKNTFLTEFTPFESNSDRSLSTSMTVDKLYNINIKTTKRLPNDVEITGDDVFVLNNAAKKFMLVMTDSLGDEAELINPIDTLGTTYKYAGDYGVGKKNIIAIRDNIKSGRVNFFIHLEEKNSECSGELKGEATIVSENTIEYRKAGDPCVLQFVFDKNHVTLKEIDGCGSRMGALDCTFNGRYPKKKEEKH